MTLKTRLFIMKKHIQNSPGLSPRAKKIIKNVLLLLLGLFIGAFLSVPFFWMFYCAFKESTKDIYIMPPSMPNLFNFTNFKEFLTDTPFLNQLKNTIIVVSTSMFLSIGATIFVAYGFARFNGRGKKIFFGLLLSTMMLPWVVTMVPAYILFANLGMVENEVFPWMPLVIPCIGGSAYNIFLLKQFIEGIPKELDEAAKIDGCGSFRILFKILLPNCLPILATIVIFSFIGTWGDYIGPSIYLTNPDNYTLALGIQYLKNQSAAGVMNWPLVMAGCAIYSIPIIIIFATCQKAYVRGAIGSAIK